MRRAAQLSGALRTARRVLINRQDEARVRALVRSVARAPVGDDVLPSLLCADVRRTYAELQPAGRVGFLAVLATHFDVDGDAVARASAAFDGVDAADDAARLGAQAALRAALAPTYEALFDRLAQEDDGLRFLVGLRADLLGALDGGGGGVPATAEAASALVSAGERPRLLALDGSLRRQLSRWFDTGLLSLQRLDWDATPAALLGRLIELERVHTFGGWGDLRARLAAPRRQIFAFTHPCMEGEPLVFVQVALADAVPRALRDVLAPPPPGPGAPPPAASPPEPEGEAAADDGGAPPPTVACFYSISSPFVGLRGVPLGRLLIKQVAAALSRQSPELRTFVTLSPVPGFGPWLRGRLAAADVPSPAANGVALDVAMGELRTAMAAAAVDDDALWSAPPPAAATDALLRLCALYLCTVKRGGGGGGGGRPADPVAAFHLRNGATLLALRPAANPSERGLRESAGLMVNYAYELGAVDANHSRHVATGDVIASEEVVGLCGGAPASKL